MNARETASTRSSCGLPSRRALPPFEALRAFDAIARLGGIRRAAQYLCRDHGVISRHLRIVERWTGTQLVRRTAGGAVLTEDGQRYHREIASAMNTIAGATMDLIKRGDNRALHILCMPGFALHWLASRLGDFERANPDSDIQLRPAHRSPELLAQDADVEIRLSPSYGSPLRLTPDLRSTEIVRAPIFAVASQEHLASTTPVREPRDLLSHPLLHEENFDRWRSYLGAHGIHEEMQLTGPRLWQVQLTLDAARHGRGIALANSLIVADDLAAGRLTEVGKNCAGFATRTEGIYYLIGKADRWDTPLLRRFRHWLTATLERDNPELQIAQTA